MSHSLFSDKRASTLLSRVSEDLQQLRHDVSSLLGHTTRHTLPEGARELADTARSRLRAGTNYAASQLRSLRGCGHKVDPTTGIIAGAALVGLIGLGVYALCKHRCCEAEEALENAEEEEEL
ncbi:MAG: hypothetical protein QM627_09225 [Luteolibacter sp.]